jgi:putative flippase GtrA
VTVVHRLYVRFRQIIHEFAKFGIIGVVGLAITNVGYDLMHSHGVGPVTSTTIATIIATIMAYIGNRYWSFKHRERTNIPREGIIFFVLNGIGLLIQDAAVAFNSYALHLEHHKLAEFIALNTGIAIATVFRFWSYRKFVWRLSPSDESGTGAKPVPEAPSGHPSAIAKVPAAQPGTGTGQLSPAEVTPGAPHQNGHAPAGRAAHRGSFSRS